MIKDYLNELKKKGNFSCAEISNLSGIPEATIRKILSGETADPRYDTLLRIVTAMGGSMDEIAGHEKEVEIETNVIIKLKEAYEERIADIKEHMASIRKDKIILAITTGVLILFIILLLVLDVSIRNNGWIYY